MLFSSPAFTVPEPSPLHRWMPSARHSSSWRYRRTVFIRFLGAASLVMTPGQAARRARHPRRGVWGRRTRSGAVEHPCLHFARRRWRTTVTAIYLVDAGGQHALAPRAHRRRHGVSQRSRATYRGTSYATPSQTSAMDVRRRDRGARRSVAAPAPAQVNATSALARTARAEARRAAHVVPPRQSAAQFPGMGDRLATVAPQGRHNATRPALSIE